MTARPPYYCPPTPHGPHAPVNDADILPPCPGREPDALDFTADERATLERFRSAPDPWAGDLTHPLQGRLLLHKGIVFEGYEDTGEDRRVTEDLYDAQAVTSLATDLGHRQAFAPPEAPWHYPVLDLDVPAWLVPSSTPGHSHLYIDHVLPWDHYVKLLKVLAEIGILEEGYVQASIDRGHTALRLPWVKKWTNDRPTTWPPTDREDPFA